MAFTETSFADVSTEEKFNAAIPLLSNPTTQIYTT